MFAFPISHSFVHLSFINKKEETCCIVVLPPISQKEIREKIMEEGEIQELAPFFISTLKPSLTRFIYVSPDAIIKVSRFDCFRFLFNLTLSRSTCS